MNATNIWQGERGKRQKHRELYCGRALDGPAGGSGGYHMRVPVPCPDGGLVHVRCELERADRIVREHVDPSSCIACHSEWMEASRPPHPAEPA